MAPKWPQVNNGPEHINEHATYLREACHQLQAVDKGRQNQIPWNIVQQYMESTIALAGKVLRQPAMSDILHHIQDTARCTQNIQRDVSVIKNSVGLSTAPLNTVNFSGGKAAAATWAQMAAQAKGRPAIPPPVPQNTHAIKTQPTVTAYKDRAVTVRLKDHGIAQRFRTLPVARIKQQVVASIHNHATTKSVAVVAAHQLKSGDIQIFTTSTAEATKLKENRNWVSGLGDHAELIVPTYGVIVHGISTNSINMKDQKATIQRILADNYTVIHKAKISFVGWLTRESTLKRASSIVVEFTEPEMANAIIYTGMAWDGQIHTCQLYDRACRVKQCFRCHNYGHIGTQCDAAQTCGYCAELHETKNCKQKGVEGFTPRCAVCKNAHTAWSNACPARRKEMGRIEQAKQARNTYWQVAPKGEPLENNNPRKRSHQARSPTPDQTITIETPREELPDDTAFTQGAPRTQRRNSLREPRATQETVNGQAHADMPSAEDRATPAPQQPAIDPQPLATEQPQETDPTTHAISNTISNMETIETVPAETAPTQQPLDPLDTMHGELDITDADEWLASLANVTEDWPHDLGTMESVPTSTATNTHITQGGIFKGCRCPEHQEIYSNWPTHDAELTIAHCTKICMYCGKDFMFASALRKHLRIGMRYIQKNLKIRVEARGRWGAPTPGWTPRQPRNRTPRSRSPPRQPRDRETRNRSPTNSPNATSRLC